jgi:hypothetical protein
MRAESEPIHSNSKGGNEPGGNPQAEASDVDCRSNRDRQAPTVGEIRGGQDESGRLEGLGFKIVDGERP